MDKRLTEYVMTHGREKSRFGNEWISTKDKFPEYEEKVLCCAFYNGKPFIFQNQYLGGETWLSDTSKVTHWTKLPKPPMEDD